MRLLVVSSEYGEDGGGLSTACSRFVDMIKKLGIECYLYINNARSANGYIAASGGYNPKLQHQLYMGGIIKSVANEYIDKNIDYVIAFGAGENGLMAAILAKQMCCKFIIMLRGSDINLSLYDERQYYANFAALKDASYVIALSEELISNAKKIVCSKNTKYFVIPNAREIPEINLKKNKRSQQKIILGTGAYHLNEKKGIGNLINVIKILNEKYKEHSWHLELVGSIDTDLLISYKTLAKENNLESNIEFVGSMSRDLFIKRMQSWNMYIQGSVFEGYSNSVVEAVSAGIPVFLSNTGFFAENLKGEYPEMVFDSFYPEKIAEKVYKYRCIDNKDDYVKRYTEVIRKLISVEKIYGEWKKLFNEMSASNKIIECVMFHDINNSYSGIDYAVEGFQQLVELVYKEGYELCSAKQFFNSASKKPRIICTFDDAYRSVYENAFPILNKYGFNATVFVCPDLIGKNNSWNHKDSVIRQHMNMCELKQLAEATWEIGSHGLSHINMKKYSESELVNMLLKSKQLLEGHFGEVTSFCYPFGEYNDFIANMVGKVYTIAFSTNNGGNIWPDDRYAIKRMTPEKLKYKIGVNL